MAEVRATSCIDDARVNLGQSPVLGRTRTIRRLVMLAAAAALVAACGGDDDEAEPAAPADRPSAPAVEPSFPPGEAITLPNGGTLTVIAGSGTQGTSGDGGPALDAALNGPFELAFDGEGNLYIGQDFRISKVDSDGVITTVAGTGTEGYSGDGGPAIEAEISRVNGVALDPDGNLYFADWRNHVIRRVDTAGTITTVAGTRAGGFAPDGTPASEALLNEPGGIAFGPDGTLYFSDQANHRVAKIDQDGLIVNVAGTREAGDAGDGGSATDAQLSSPSDLAFDVDGNLYIGTGTTVRKVDTGGTITTVSGEISDAIAVAPDGAGNLYAGEYRPGKTKVRSADGSVTTILELGQIQGLSPCGVAVDRSDNLYITDCTVEHRVYKFEP